MDKHLTALDYSNTINAMCPHCARGIPVEQNPATGEYTHTWRSGTIMSHTICQASEFRHQLAQAANNG